jgi:hypothetical protein
MPPVYITLTCTNSCYCSIVFPVISIFRNSQQNPSPLELTPCSNNYFARVDKNTCVKTFIDGNSWKSTTYNIIQPIMQSSSTYINTTTASYDTFFSSKGLYSTHLPRNVHRNNKTELKTQNIFNNNSKEMFALCLRSSILRFV